MATQAKDREAIQAESLTRAVSGQTLTNFPAIFQGFLAKGIPADEIKPRENVFTYNAWLALGRQVRKGEHGVKVVTFREEQVRDMEAGPDEYKSVRRPWGAAVFHVSQTDPVQA
jgi:hypothetical protein